LLPATRDSCSNPLGYLCETGILLLALSRYSYVFYFWKILVILWRIEILVRNTDSLKVSIALYESAVSIVMDSEVEECVDPGGNGAMLNVREGGGPSLPREVGNGQLALDSGGD
jgi:hypothetical protein